LQPARDHNFHSILSLLVHQAILCLKDRKGKVTYNMMLQTAEVPNCGGTFQNNITTSSTITTYIGSQDNQQSSNITN
jgi:hypothetical protein